MIKFAVGIICYYIVYCAYHVYQNVRTPIYEYAKDVKKNEKDQEGLHVGEKYIHRAFTNFLKQKDKVDYHLYMSCEENIDLNRYVSEKDKFLEKNKNFINVHNFNNISYDWNYSDPVEGETKWWNFLSPRKYRSVEVTIPSSLIKKNKEIYLHILTYVNGELYRHGFVTSILTREKVGAKKSTAKEKYLWERLLEEEEEMDDYNDDGNDDMEESEDDNDNDDEDEENEQKTQTDDSSNDRQRKSVSKQTQEGVKKKNNKMKAKKRPVKKKKKKKKKNFYIPKKVKFGPVIEHNDINVNKIGFFSNIFLDTENSVYLLPTYYNDHLTPEDEYELLQIVWEGEKEDVIARKRKKNNTQHDHVTKSDDNYTHRGNIIEIELSPISLPQFNLYNIILFNINYAKEKYKFVTYDLDNLIIHFCGNIYLCLIIFILCFILLLMDLMALLFDWSRWNRVNDLYSFPSYTVHFKLIFTLFIFLYLKNKNSCNILMVFCVAKMAVCLWKLLDHYDIEFMEIHPYVRITRNIEEISNIGERGNENQSIDKGAIIQKNQFRTELENIETYIKMKMPNVMFCTVVSMCAYNFIYTQYESIYAFIIHSIAICSYIFNFVFMCPQIVRNYYTRTVERVPLFFLFFLFLYALMDDLFVLVLRIPLVHKWNALGDDIVFFIFFVQYCVYKKGKSRVGSGEVAAAPQGAKPQRESKKKK
ncbi:serpentine receptor, putative [Plasmodium knowlesi strain H]|uniref:Serpentine receptor, putative n=2 Tax=Plasmodium knowlesi TaxID=5850 RepID=B3L5B7_PLAKH|nr:serpentine receptor, putative [Plasmodium knowlesi strain H]OTN64950.1 Uncharacterized protein PKNOH_S120147900 [Plasmodium knowlesi]CAA9988336.1 serpentine receptor, putative [Plasmodium knowlesi strain H]VVS77810.1 serpentine receptor, putative [Plasmodium knowlesi strain H]|eukprot:XP_002259315.1 hypothetical protein, conserved in Plasmodium species [Plasmodium knowlesi strain H]